MRVFGLLFALMVWASPVLALDLKDDEEVIFFPTAAHWDVVQEHWVIPVHFWVFEPERDSLLRNAAIASLAAALGLDDSAVQSKIFRERAHWFLVDNESGKYVRPDFSPKALGPTGDNGHYQTRRVWRGDGRPRDLRTMATFPGQRDPNLPAVTVFAAPTGLSVISDIDDTIKISQVRDKTALMENTFLKPFQAAPGMVVLYDRLADRGAVFHYVSSSPWQLFPELAKFFKRAAFPMGSFHLKSVRLKDETLLNLFQSSTESKPPIIEDLLARWPRRQFILIGDSGEHDPEIYGDIARRHPGQITRILIRDVTGESARNARYARAFRGLPANLWTVFENTSEIIY